MEGHLKRHIDIDNEGSVKSFDAGNASLQSFTRIVRKEWNVE